MDEFNFWHRSLGKRAPINDKRRVGLKGDGARTTIVVIARNHLLTTVSQKRITLESTMILY